MAPFGRQFRYDRAVKTARSHWTATDADTGVRLDKFLAAPERLASRGKAVAALERGKVYVNDDEVDIKEAARRLVAGDVVRVWADRPGSARPRPRTGPTGDLDVIYEDDDVACRQQAGRYAVGPARAQPGCSLGLRPDCAALSFPRETAAIRGSSHRPGHIRPGGLRQGPDLAAAAEDAIRPSSAGTSLSCRRLRAPHSPRRNLAGCARVGYEGADSERDPPA